jgi:mannose-6-phosphate isomerase-like protein (cupin superfamily)
MSNIPNKPLILSLLAFAQLGGAVRRSWSMPSATEFHYRGRITMSTILPVLVRAAEAEVLPETGVTLFADIGDTGGHLTSHRTILEPGKDGAPPHRHSQASELFFLLSGNLRVLLGDDIVVLAEGDFLVVPPNTPHAFDAVGDEDTEVLFVLTQAKPRFDYYRLLESVHRGETHPAEIGRSSDRFDNHYVDSPAWQSRKS